MTGFACQIVFCRFTCKRSIDRMSPVGTLVSSTRPKGWKRAAIPWRCLDSVPTEKHCRDCARHDKVPLSGWRRFCFSGRAEFIAPPHAVRVAIPIPSRGAKTHSFPAPYAIRRELNTTRACHVERKEEQSDDCSRPEGMPMGRQLQA